MDNIQTIITLDTDHGNLVARLKKSGHVILSDMTPEQAELLHWGIGVSGEAGELLDAIKKHVIYQKPLDRDNICEELGDLEFFCRAIRDLLGMSREEILNHNIIKLTKRYGQTYSNAAAQDRADKK